MKWIGRIALVLAFFSLFTLAALPYLEPAREKWDRFREAWELVNRAPSTTEALETETSEPEETIEVGEQNILPPDVETMEVKPSITEDEDPFLAEAREWFFFSPGA